MATGSRLASSKARCTPTVALVAPLPPEIDHRHPRAPESRGRHGLERRERVRVEDRLAVGGEREQGATDEAEKLPVLAHRPPCVLAGRDRVEDRTEVVRIECPDEPAPRARVAATTHG